MLIVPRETKQKSLEEIAAAFGDRVVNVKEYEAKARMEDVHGKATVAHAD
jgi:hypothetical protein